MAIQDDFGRLKAFSDGSFEGLCTPAEFAEVFGIDESAVRHAIRSGRLTVGIDCWKFGKQWVLSSNAFRTYGGSYSKLSQIKADYYKAVKARTE